MPNKTYILHQGQDADLHDLVVASLKINGAAVVTALLLASGQAADLNGEAAGLILDALATIVLHGATAGHAKITVSGATVFDLTAAGLALTGTLNVSGLLAAAAAMTVGTTLGVTGVLSANGGVKRPVQVGAADGAITVKDGFVLLTKAGVAVMTLADPVAGTDDGKELTVIAQTANAHTVTIEGGLNGAGAAADVGTFGGAVGDRFSVVAYNGKWYASGVAVNVVFA